MTSCYLCIQVLDETCDRPDCSLVRLLARDQIQIWMRDLPCLVMVLPSSQKRSTLLQVSSEEQKVSITLPHVQLLSLLYTFLHLELHWQLCKQTSSIERKVLKPKSGYERALQSWSEEHRVMMQEMQDRQNRWAEEQQQHREQRERMLQQQEENLLSRLLEQNSRSTERLVGMMFEGLRSLLPTPQIGPPLPPYNSYPQSRYPVPHQQHHPQPQSPLQNFPRQSENPEDQSEYTLQRLY